MKPNQIRKYSRLNTESTFAFPILIYGNEVSTLRRHTRLKSIEMKIL